MKISRSRRPSGFFLEDTSPVTTCSTTFSGVAGLGVWGPLELLGNSAMTLLSRENLKPLWGLEVSILGLFGFVLTVLDLLNEGDELVDLVVGVIAG
jgi:hypothetical protein